MTSVKAQLARVLKEKYQANSVKVVWVDAGVKVSDAAGKILVTVRTDEDTDPTVKLETVIALFQENGFETELSECSNPVTKNGSVTMGATFDIKPTVEPEPEKPAGIKRKRSRNNRIEDWPKDGVFNFRIQNFNRRDLGDIHIIPVEYTDLASWRDVVISGDGTGGYELILDYSDAEGNLIGWIKKYCAKSHAFEYIPEDKRPTFRRGRKLEQQSATAE